MLIGGNFTGDKFPVWEITKVGKVRVGNDRDGQYPGGKCPGDNCLITENQFGVTGEKYLG